MNANFNGHFGNDDEYIATLSGLASGTYYYASRFQYNGGPYVYGGINSNGTSGGNFWDGMDFVNGVLSVDTVDFCSLEFPGIGTINLGDPFAVYGQVFEFGVTDTANNQGGGITAEVGYNTTNTNPDTWTNWIPTAYNTTCLDCNNDNNDEYSADLGVAITSPGIYYYALRYTFNSGAYSYGGILADGSAGSFWDGTTYISGVLTVEAPEINVEGDINTFPDIMDGDTSPGTFDNTQFANRAIGASQTKSFRIQNLGNGDLSISNLQMLGTHPSDFTLTLPSPLPITIPANDLIVFDVTFSPTAIGIREATVTITNDDPTGNEGVYDYLVRGTGLCSGGILNLYPSTGPANTIVTVNGNNFGGSTTATLNGIDVTSNISVINASELEFIVPNGAYSGTLEVTNNLGCPSSNSFTVIDTVLSSCDGGSNLIINDLFISEVTDKGSGSHSYIELYNGTGTTYNLDNYEIRIHNNGATSATSTIQLTGTLLSGNIYVIGFGGTNGADNEGYIADITSSVSGINNNDHIRLYYDDDTTETWIDLWGNTTNTAFTIAPNDYVYRRLDNGITVPSTTWTPADWTAQSPVDYSDIGNFNYTLPTPPIVNGISALYTTCEDVTITVDATEGVSAGNGLTYQWYYFNPNETTLPEWKPISDDAIFSNSTTHTLTITNANALSDYQFYCEVREDDASCYTASDAIKFNVAEVTWNGGTWVWSDGTADGTLPTAANVVTIDGIYNTEFNGGSFSVCSLILNSGRLTVADGDYVEVINNVDINNSANMTIETQGSFIQRGVGGDAGYFSNNGSGNTDVIKTTAPLNDSYDYTYWSSPVVGQTVGNALFFSNPNRRFWFDANNFIDLNTDGVDDNGDSWTLAGTTYPMTPGQGFASTHGSFPMGYGVGYDYMFRGNYNTGDITYSVAYDNQNDPSLHWNLIGNPYPSALDADLFFAENGIAIYEAIYMWSHVRQPDGANPGNEVLNFNQNDYVTINFVGEAGNGIDGAPERKVPSGQGFFIPSKISGDVRFTNAMRVSGNDENDQFFRSTTNNTTSHLDREAFWLNLSSDIGIYSQICVAYADIATDGFDGNAIDTKRNYAGNAGMIYSMIEDDLYSNYVIQGKALSSLNEDEVVPIGFGAYISTSALYTLDIIKTEGEFLTNNPVYIKDSYLNIIHDLGESSYQFTSEGGTFNDRFSLVFKNENTLSEDELELKENGLSIVELQNGHVQFTLKNSNLSISEVSIFDLQGRLIYKLHGNSSSEVYQLYNLSSATYIAKVELSNGQIITKKAIKKL